uniref:NOT2/NOT3/NOT5 C-terminal domain-containing protein n=1 Tax=Clastoptera arizonana TaxID=38151 RepID=A0A1B6CNW3_9HEMI
MANLNFQQPPRSIANQGLSRNSFATNSLSGHVTPTSGMFPGSSSSFTPQQLSPNRSLPPLANRGLFGQRPFTERRPVQGLGSVMQDWSSNPMGNMGSFSIPQNRSYGSQGVGMVKQPTSESSEFTMSNEDFPALPGTASTEGPSPGSSIISSSEKSVSQTGSSEVSTQQQDLVNNRLAIGSDKAQALKRGIQTSPDGKVTNIPASMVKDQFGMVGLLTFIRAAETDPNLVSLALGQDLTALGLNLNSPENLYPNFGGPWAEHPCRPQDIDYHIPPEYLINCGIREKLAQIKLTKYKDDLLFYMFYTNTGELMQLAAAAELYTREWRYHMEEKVWITQAPGLGAVEKTSTYERGTYYFFDAQNWRKVPKEFHLDYSKLENRPTLPTQYLNIL